MDKQLLISEVKYLISKNKTQEALKLLSKIQLSENDKTVVLLMGQLEKLQRDSILNKISNEELNKTQASINESILMFSENIDPSEMEVNSQNQTIPPVVSSPETPKIESKPTIDRSTLNITQVPNAGGANFLNKNVLLIGSAVVLMLAFTLYRVWPKEVRINESTQIIPVESSNSDNWAIANTIYLEDFRDRRKSGFRSDIWKLENKINELWTGIKDNQYYLIDIKNEDKFPSRHKYLGKLPYNSNFDVTPYFVRIKNDPEIKCQTENSCLGRGLTVRYDNKKKSAYAFVINDQNYLSFIKMDDFKKPQSGKVLYSATISDLKSNYVELGIESRKNKFWLYLDRKLVKIIEDDSVLTGKYNGVIAIGEGMHMFDEVYLGKPID